MAELPPFHLAFPVNDLAEARHFYGEILNCPEGRSDRNWIDFDFFGHQIVTHLDEAEQPRPASGTVDGRDVPVPHFGVVLDWEAFHTLCERLEAAGIEWKIAPNIRFADEPGEQATMFFTDPSGNALEFKAFRNRSQLFACD
ncbi:VOC family protein [Parasphingopyxis sp.]|uniref:VOC family protein n=1 Tax=Parasphingopyxis sp. TaxID=1920299 RepID=UPI0026068956|nr:VOC family protein [Parasphingopyxis sp.]